MTDKTKYKSVAIDHDCYKKIEELALSLHPGVTLSRAQVVKILVNNKCLEDEKYSYEYEVKLMDKIHEIRVEEVHDHDEGKYFYRVYMEINETIKIIGESEIKPELIRYTSKVY